VTGPRTTVSVREWMPSLVSRWAAGWGGGVERKT